jgi:protein-S-isoprenylcysteine O-methyltransferase Ste14
MSRALILVYGIVSYLFFLVTFCYAIGFVEGVVVPKGIDDAFSGTSGPSALVNVVLLGLFAVQHTIMARPAFKRWWCGIIPRPAERSTFVLLASAILVLMMWQWRPLPAVVWDVQTLKARSLLLGVSLAGWLLVLYATFVIDHFDLFGLKQVWTHFRGIEYHHPPFSERSVYRFVRHPLMAGFIVAFWAAPTMTQGRLLFAAVTTAYILVAIRIEESDLVAMLGQPYMDYRRRTPALIPIPRRARPL